MAATFPTGSAIASRVPAAAGRIGAREDGEVLLVVALRAAQRVLATCVMVLAAAGLATVLLKFGLGDKGWVGYLRLFDLDQEQNLPTWFSSFLLLLVGVLLYAIAVVKLRSKDRWRLHWVVLSVIFVFLSLDEFAQLHERTIPMLRRAHHFSGLFRFAWVVPASVLLVVFAAIYARFTLALPPRTRNLFVLSAGLYVGGALGLEMIGGAYAQGHGTVNLGYGLLTCVEETLEMTGLALFVYTLADYIRGQWGGLALSFEP